MTINFHQISPYHVYELIKDYGDVEQVWGGESELHFNVVRSSASDKMKPHIDMLAYGTLNIRVVWLTDYTKRGCLYADPCNDMHPALFESPANPDSPKQLLNLFNDHLLLTIIERNVLDFDDLLALSATCTRFFRLAKRYIAVHHQAAVNQHLADIAYAPIWEIDQYLQRFGDLVTSVEVNNVRKKDRLVIGLIDRYCSNIAQIRCIVSDTLGRWSDFGDLLSADSKLKSLSVASLTRNLSMPTFTIPSLVEVRLEHAHLTRVSSIQPFFAMNPQIRKVTMKNVWITQMNAAVAIQWHRLRSLSFSSTCITDSINMLASLHQTNVQLKRLVLDDKQLPLAQDVVYSLIARMKTLHCLRLHGSDVMMLRFSKIVALAQRLPKLRDFTLSSCALTFRHLQKFLQRTEAIPLRNVTFVMHTAVDWTSVEHTLRNIRRLAAARRIHVKGMVISTVRLDEAQKRVS